MSLDCPTAGRFTSAKGVDGSRNNILVMSTPVMGQELFDIWVVECKKKTKDII